MVRPQFDGCPLWGSGSGFYQRKKSKVYAIDVDDDDKAVVSLMRRSGFYQKGSSGAKKAEDRRWLWLSLLFKVKQLKIQNIKVRLGMLLQNCVKRKKLKNIYQRDLFQEWDGLPLNSGTCVLWNSKLVPTLSKVRPLLLYTAAEFSWDTCSSNIIDTTWQWIIWINCLQIN